jgi:hypothetical protein
MRNRRKALLWTLAVLLTVPGVVLLCLPRRHPDKQPIYNGLTLTQWLDVVARHRVYGYFTTYQKGRPSARDATPEEIKEAEDAIRAIGTNAYPCLLEWTGYKPSFGKRFVRGILEVTIDKTHMAGVVRDPYVYVAYKREGLADLGMHGLRVLHTNAPAFEALSKMASDTNNPWMQERAAKALLTITNAPGQ